jgi:hypothetical protein
MKLQKLGGYASIFSIILLGIEIGLAVLILPRLGLPLFSNTAIDPLKIMAAYESSPSTVSVLRPIPALIAIALVLVALALQERMRVQSPNIMRIAVIAASVAFALLLANTIGGTTGMLTIASSKDISAYRAFTSVQNGLQTAGLTSWGLALFLMGWASIKTGALPRILGYLCLVCGIGGIMVTFMPNMPNVVGLIGLLLNIVGAAWLGIELIRKPEPSPAQL